jgi:hypothetical protein
MGDQYLASRIHDILEGRIAMGGARKKRAKSKAKKKTRKTKKMSKSKKRTSGSKVRHLGKWMSFLKRFRKEHDGMYTNQMMMKKAGKAYQMEKGGIKRAPSRYKDKHCSVPRKIGNYWLDTHTDRCITYKSHKAMKGSKKKKVTKRKKRRGSGGCDGEVCAFNGFYDY